VKKRTSRRSRPKGGRGLIKTNVRAYEDVDWFVWFVVQPSTGLLWAHEHSDGGSVRTRAGDLLLS